MNENEKDDKKG